MIKGGYKYNPDTLDFENTERSKAKKMLINGLSVLVSALIIAVVVFFAFVLYFNMKMKNERMRENEILQAEYEKLLKRKEQNNAYLKELIKKDEIIYKSVFKSLPDNSVFEEQNPYKRFSDYSVKQMIKDNSSRLQSVRKRVKTLDVEHLEFNKLMEKAELNKRNIPSIQPVYNYNLKYPVYGYGKRIDHVYKSLIVHPGFDFAVPEGTPVFAAADGVVEKSGRKRGLGKRIVINHNNDYKTVYAHLEDLDVRKGKTVKKGQKIGTVGMTGKTLISHLHYEVEYKNKPVNPVHYFFLDLTPQKFATIISESNKSGLSLD